MLVVPAEPVGSSRDDGYGESWILESSEIAWDRAGAGVLALLAANGWALHCCPPVALSLIQMSETGQGFQCPAKHPCLVLGGSRLRLA